MTEREAYTDYLLRLRLRHFQPHEVINYADRARDGVKNSLPPAAMWPSIVPALWLLDFLRESFGAAITLTSIYRSPAYNRAVGGAASSFHMQNKAIDFQVRGVTPVKASNRLREWRTLGLFRGGIGIYSTFTHVDVRGENADWDNR